MVLRPLRLWALMLAAWTLLPACGTSPASAPASQAPPDRLTVAYSQKSGDQLPVWVAKEDGIFARNRLDIDLQLIGGGSNTMSALLSGQLQIGQLGGSEVLSAVSQGADLVVLATLTPVYPYVFMVPASIRTAADLKGKRVGVSSLGGSADIATRQGLRQVGLDPEKDVTIVPLGTHEIRTAALVSGSIQGGVDDPPGSVKLEAKGLRPLFDLASQKLPAANNTVVAQRAWVAAHRDIAQRYIDSVVQATVRLKRDQALTVRVLKLYFQSEDDRVMSQTADFFTKEVLTTLPYPEPGQFADAKTVLGRRNEKARTLDVATVLDRSFVKSAADRGLEK